ncbi:MAG: PLP-dependent aminotransferase family protein [Clostridia bacterium]|nr:PLP-dependent aminotransferase family protein [Clostridia bacterium]
MKKYLELYEYYKERILSGQLRYEDRLPSIREASAIHGVSRTTVENAYFALQAEGFLKSSERSGYYVSRKGPKNRLAPEPPKDFAGQVRPKFDLSSGDADRQSFDVKLWHRYINSALRQEERLCSYSEPQGEADLREAIVDYIRKKRNVIADKDQIVIGAGVDTLLDILCTLLPKDKTVSFPDESFQKGISRFREYGFDVHFRDKDATIIYVSPSHMTRFGDVMPMKRRLELVEYSEAHGTLVLEDDYDNDFLYATRPTPSLYALASADNVVYMSSFANVLTPGIRISFMVLPEVLAKQYREEIWRFSQTASKTEQIALCGYIRDGHIGAQIRKVRRFATAKTRRFYELLAENLTFEDCHISENGLQIMLTVPFTGTREDFDAAGLSVFWEAFDGRTARLTLLPSALPEEDFPAALEAFKAVLKQ